MCNNNTRWRRKSGTMQYRKISVCESFFNHDKGFGFIRDLGSGESIFVHINNVNGDELNENNRVTFEVEQGPRGLAAIKVNKA